MIDPGVRVDIYLANGLEFLYEATDSYGWTGVPSEEPEAVEKYITAAGSDGNSFYLWKTSDGEIPWGTWPDSESNRQIVVNVFS